ncbi:MAG: hypothetical protein M1814_004965 [Vezdaea aestivalis]|nr:MAG: hypothetical protein M1814_004965 [Vezdaea aestivalis]
MSLTSGVPGDFLDIKMQLMNKDDDITRLLERASKDGSFNLDNWSSIVGRILNRLESIVRDDFPPVVYRPALPVVRPQDVLPSQDTSEVSQFTNKENAAPPSSPPTITRPPVPIFPVEEAEKPGEDFLDGLPSHLKLIIKTITTNLTSNFSLAPPYTFQRFSELILNPRTHYRTLPTYLNALDRVLSVSSPVSIFPLVLPTISNDSQSALQNGLVPGSAPAPLGSDESLGGALLSPIPWLRDHHQQQEIRTESTQMINGPNGTGSMETVTVSMNGVASLAPSPAAQLPDSMHESGAVSQGELLRQEQEAGIIPVTQTQQAGRQTRSATRSAAALAVAAEKETEGEVEETPHVRGPEEVGVEDTGPQDTEKIMTGTFDIEAATGRSLTAEVEKEEDQAMEQRPDGVVVAETALPPKNAPSAVDGGDEPKRGEGGAHDANL